MTEEIELAEIIKGAFKSLLIERGEYNEETFERDYAQANQQDKEDEETPPLEVIIGKAIREGIRQSLIIAARRFKEPRILEIQEAIIHDISQSDKQRKYGRE